MSRLAATLAMTLFASAATAQGRDWGGLYIGAAAPWTAAVEYVNTQQMPTSFEGVEGAGSALGLGGFAGFNFDLGSVVLGAELAFTRFAVDDFSLNTSELMLRAGLDRGQFLPYIGLSAAQSAADIDGDIASSAAATYSLGMDLAVTDRAFIGAMASLPDFSSNEERATLTATSGVEQRLGFDMNTATVSLRAGFRF